MLVVFRNVPPCRRSSLQALLRQAMVEDALAQALDLPYNVFASGPYTPPCQEERLAYSASLGLTGSPPPDPQVGGEPQQLRAKTDRDAKTLLPGVAPAAGWRLMSFAARSLSPSSQPALCVCRRMQCQQECICRTCRTYARHCTLGC